MLEKLKYVDVILPLPVKGKFTYYTHEEIEIGQRVIVQFGFRKLYTAIIVKTHNNPPEDYSVKEILAIMDEPPIVNALQLSFWQWMANYYMCNLGDVMNAALPASLKLASESKVILHPSFDGDLQDLHQQEIKLIDILLEHKELNIAELSLKLNVKNTFAIINQLLRKEIVQIKEELHEKFKEKTARILSFISNEQELSNIRLTKKQTIFINSFFELQKKYPKKQWAVADILKQTGCGRSILNALLKKNLFEIRLQSVSRLLHNETIRIENNQLVNFQKHALEDIKKSFLKKDVCLLHGVTSSGKTEIYIKLIHDQLKKGKQVLYLLPEIALTTQVIKRLQQHFGNRVGVTHSHLNNAERVEIWKAVQEDDKQKVQYPIMLGARSSLFLPYKNLGLIIVDEEHDSSFKQHQPSPRYHARDAAIYLATLHSAKVLLGSATPSIESYFHTQNKKYGLVEMHSRFSDIELPKIEIIDIRKAHLKKEMKYQFAPKMLVEIKEALGNGKQVILFQNRRGYSPILSCQTCSFTPNCVQCDVSLTYHKWNNYLKCHYCGYTEELTKHCPSCSNKEFNDQGFGTEQIEESLKELFPDIVVRRMDYDTTRKKYAYQEIITDFEDGRINILVGTQMVTKGLDFDNVAVVGILNADNMLKFPDFRSYERAFQLMVQVAGRAGRKNMQGKVLVQTYDDDNEIFRLLRNHDYISFINKQIKERELFNYPPYNRLISVILKHKDQQSLDKCAELLAIQMRKSFDNRILGPEYPAISRIRNFYHKSILLKIELDSSVTKAKSIIGMITNTLREKRIFRSVRIVIDVDPI